MFAAITRKFFDWRERQIAVRHLQRLEDRLLADMGTTRDDLACFVAGPDCEADMERTHLGSLAVSTPALGAMLISS